MTGEGGLFEEVVVGRLGERPGKCGRDNGRWTMLLYPETNVNYAGDIYVRVCVCVCV